MLVSTDIAEYFIPELLKELVELDPQDPNALQDWIMKVEFNAFIQMHLTKFPENFSALLRLQNPTQMLNLTFTLLPRGQQADLVEALQKRFQESTKPVTPPSIEKFVTIFHEALSTNFPPEERLDLHIMPRVSPENEKYVVYACDITEPGPIHANLALRLPSPLEIPREEMEEALKHVITQALDKIYAEE